MDTREIISSMFSRIEVYRRSSSTIKYSLDVSLESYKLSLYFKHDTNQRYNRIVWTSEPIHHNLVRCETLDFLRAAKEIGNRYIRELNTTP